MKYNTGDPVWAHTSGDWMPETSGRAYPGEHPAVVTSAPFSMLGDIYYQIDVLDCPCPEYKGWHSRERSLRPRRDDYQQHEGLGTWDECKSPTKALEPA